MKSLFKFVLSLIRFVFALIRFAFAFAKYTYRKYKFFKSLSPINRELYLNLKKLERIEQKNRKVLKKLGLLN